MHSRTKSAPSRASPRSVVVVMRATVLLDLLRRADAPFGEEGQIVPDAVAHPAEELVVQALQPHLVAGHGEGLAAGLAHHARADDGDPLLCRLRSSARPLRCRRRSAAPSARLAWTQYMPSRLRPL